MSKPEKHKTRLLKLITKLREDVCSLLNDGHLEYPYKSLPEIERDIDCLVQEIERTELSKEHKE